MELSWWLLRNGENSFHSRIINKTKCISVHWYSCFQAVSVQVLSLNSLNFFKHQPRQNCCCCWFILVHFWVSNIVVPLQLISTMWSSCCASDRGHCQGSSSLQVRTRTWMMYSVYHSLRLADSRRRLMINMFFWSATVFQFSYTAVFGAYTAFIFIRTGERLSFTSFT